MNKKANIAIAMILIVVAVVAIVSLASNANGIVNWFYEDVESGTPVAPGCTPQKYLVEFSGTLDLINDFTWSGYELTFIDAHIYDIRLSPQALAISDLWQQGFDAQVCLYDVLAGGDNWLERRVDCVRIKDAVTKGQIEKFPFDFRYNLYDNDCNGEVDDHTFNLVVDIVQEDEGPIHKEKTVAIVGGSPIFQNVKY